MADNNNQSPGDRPVSIWPTIWKFGLIIAAFRVVYNLILYTAGLAGITGTGLVGTIGAIVLLVVALKRFRASNGGYLTFGQGFGIGFVTSLISTVIRTTVDTIYLSTVGSEFLSAQLETTMNQMRANPNMTPEAMEMMRGIFETIFTPAGLFIGGIIGGVIGWLVISLIVAAAMKQPPPIKD